MSDSEVLDLIEKEVLKANRIGKHFSVVRQATRREGNWMYVLVNPEPKDMLVSSYKKALARVEDIVEREAGINLLLVPALPD